MTDERITELERAIEFALWRLICLRGKTAVDEKHLKASIKRLEEAFGRPLIAYAMDIEILPTEGEINDDLLTAGGGCDV